MVMSSIEFEQFAGANAIVQTPRLYNAANTDDVRHAINWLRDKYPENKLFAAGFSLGSQLLVSFHCDVW